MKFTVFDLSTNTVNSGSLCAHGIIQSRYGEVAKGCM